ncbi:MAG: hypothetical protein ABI833_01295 [Acidobacteriota bacterium]
MILAFAGRRVDAPDAATPRFPIANLAIVRGRIRKLLQDRAPSDVISSAACGADLIALSEAAALGVVRKIVLPFSRDRFRSTSVTDRPGDWGPLYDEVLGGGEVIELQEEPDDGAYLVVNCTILDMTSALMNEKGQPGSAVLVWEGASRGEHDLTEAFGVEARKRGLAVIEVLTI